MAAELYFGGSASGKADAQDPSICDHVCVLYEPVRWHRGVEKGLSDDFSAVEKDGKGIRPPQKICFARLRAMDCPAFEPEGAFYEFPEIKGTDRQARNFVPACCEKKSVAMVPGPAFGESGEGYVRLSYATAMDQIKIALDRMEEFVHSI